MARIANPRQRTLKDTTNDLLKNRLDKLMLQFQFTHPEFYDEYLRARTIVD